MAASTAESAIPYCSLVYLDGKDAMELCNSYFDLLLELDPEAIGNKVPDSGFWV